MSTASHRATIVALSAALVLSVGGGSVWVATEMERALTDRATTALAARGLAAQATFHGRDAVVSAADDATRAQAGEIVRDLPGVRLVAPAQREAPGPGISTPSGKPSASRATSASQSAQVTPTPSSTPTPTPTPAPEWAALRFEGGTAFLLPNSREELTQLGQYLAANPRVRVRLVGHTDTGRTQRERDKLAMERAQAAQRFLQSQGVAAGRIEVAGRAQHEPVASNDTAEGRALNRRVEIVIIEER